MTYAKNRAGEKLYFQFGDGGTPEVFSASCSINTSRAVDLTSQQWTGEVPDCANPGAPNKTVRRTKSLDIKFTGAGVADSASFKTLMNLWLTGTPFNGVIKQDTGDGDAWTLTGQFLIESIKLTGTQHEDQTFDIALAQADILTWSN
jgi:predicted secreted protein